MSEQTGIAGLPVEGPTMVSGLPVAVDEEKPPPDWPLAIVMSVIAVLGAYLLVAGQWGDVATVRPAAGVGVPELPRGGSERSSYVQPAKFRATLDEVGRRAGRDARVQLMRVDTGQVWIVLDDEGRQRVIRVSGDGITDDKGGDASGAEVRLRDIDVEAPQRMARGLRERFRVQPQQIDYFAMAGWTGTWNAFLRDGTYYAADRRGRKLVRAG